MSTTDMTKHQTMDQRTVRINRIKLIAIFAVAIVPVVLATSMYFGGFAVPSAKTNKGNLIWPPAHVDALSTSAVSEAELSLSQALLESKKWTLLITGGEHCDQACSDLIHTVRQVNVSMAKEMDRVSRVLVSSLSPSELSGFRDQYPNMSFHPLSSAGVAQFERVAAENGAVLNTENTSGWKVWIVDPLGNVIVQYTDQHTGYDMIHDLKKLLKLSNIG